MAMFLTTQGCIMNKIFFSLFTLLFSTFAAAGPYHYRHGQHRFYHTPSVYHWVVPAVIGGTIVYAATRPDPIVVQPQQPVIVTNQYMIVDGVTYKKEIMVINGILQEVWIKQ